MTKKKSSKGRRGPDRISSLPTDMMREILSCLPLIDAAVTCVLSKEWQRIWYAHPVIQLDEVDFGADYCNYSDKHRAKRFAFLTYLQNFLECRKRPSEFNSVDVDKFLLRMTVEADSPAKELINNWICYALEKNVKSLFLGLYTFKHHHYSLHGIAFHSNWLVKLSLSGCEIKCCSFELPFLKSLFLYSVCIEDYDFKNLMAGCPNIEWLCVLVNNKKLQTIVVSNPNLQFFQVCLPSSNGKIRIESPNLHSLEFVALNLDLCKVEITAKKTVRELTLQKTYHKGTVIHIINEFPLLEKLEIYGPTELQNLPIDQPNLDTLVLKDCKVKDEVRINAPKLRLFEFMGGLTRFEGIEDSKELEFVLLNLVPVSIDDAWYGWFGDILKWCARSQHLSVICNSEEVIIIPEHLRHLVSITDMEHLEIEIKTLDGTFKEVTDELISILPDLKTLSLTLGSTTKFFQIRIDEDGDLSAQEEAHNPKPNRRVSILRSMISKQIGE